MEGPCDYDYRVTPNMGLWTWNTPCRYLEYVMSPLGKVVPQVMPEQVVEHSLCDPGGPHVRDVTLLTNERQVLRLFYEYSNNNHDQ